MKFLSALLIVLIIFTASFAEASVESGNWTAYSKVVMPDYGAEIDKGPFDAYVNAGPGVIDISVTVDSSTYRFHADVNGSQLSGTVFSSSGMGSFETPFSGQISADGSRISIRLDWVWSYKGSQDRWVKKFNAHETWEFTR